MVYDFSGVGPRERNRARAYVTSEFLRGVFRDAAGRLDGGRDHPEDVLASVLSALEVYDEALR